MKKIKVIHLVEALGGGVYSYFIDLSIVMGQDTRLDVSIIYCDKRPEIIPEKVRTDIHRNVKLIRTDINKAINPYKDLKSIIKISKILKSERPDIIHIHSAKTTVIGRLAYLYSHSTANLYYTPHGFSFLRKDISWTKRKLFYIIEFIFSKLAGEIIACGDTEKEIASRFTKTHLIRNGINLRLDSKRNTIKNRFKVGTLGRVSFQKNPELFNKIAEKLPHIDFIWIGDGELRNKITSSNIEVTGWFNSKEEGLKHLHKIDIYIQTSLWEGLPIAVLEAMAFKKPIVASNVIGNKDAVENGVTGFLFDNLDEAVIKIIELTQNKAMRNNMGEMGRKRCELLFDSHKNFNQLIELYYSGLKGTKQKD